MNGRFFLLLALLWLGGSVVFADVTASLHMAISPGGNKVPAVRSGTAKVYAVLQYQDAAQIELKVLVYSVGGTVLFEHSDVYDGSGQRDIEITGRDIFSGYKSAAQTYSTDLEIAMGAADQALTASAKRVRTGTVVNIARSLDGVLAALERYPLSLTTLDHLGTARDLAAEVDTQGMWIMTPDVPDDELDAEMEELKALVTDTIATVNSAMAGIDTSVEQAWLDGTYTIQLKKNGQISDGFDWEVSPSGVPGTPVAASPTAAGPTQTPMPVATQPPISTPTETTLSPGPATATPLPSGTPPMTTPTPTVLATGQTRPITLPPTAANPVPSPRAGREGQPPAQITPLSPPAVEGQAIYPAPPTTGGVSPSTDSGHRLDATPAVQVMVQGESSQATEPADQALGPVSPEQGPGGQNKPIESQAPIVSHDTPLAPQEIKKLPVVSITAMVGAVTLGVIALWLRAKV